MVKREYLEFVLLNLTLLFLVQPGSIAFANFDAPYGFMRDITTWLSSYVGLSPVAFAYLYWKRKEMGGKAIPLYVASVLGLAYITYAVQQAHFEALRPGFHYFLLASFLGAVLSLMLLPMTLLNLREMYLNYGYDIPLGVANLVILFLIVALGRNLYSKEAR